MAVTFYCMCLRVSEPVTYMSPTFFLQTVIGCRGEIVEGMVGLRVGVVIPSIYVSVVLISDPRQLDAL